MRLDLLLLVGLILAMHVHVTRADSRSLSTSMLNCKERRRRRAVDRGFVQSAPQGHTHILVPNHLTRRARALVDALVLHEQCNRTSHRRHHFLASAIFATRRVRGKEFFRHAIRVKKKADAGRHDWDCDSFSSSASGVSGTEAPQDKRTLTLAEIISDPFDIDLLHIRAFNEIFGNEDYDGAYSTSRGQSMDENVHDNSLASGDVALGALTDYTKDDTLITGYGGLGVSPFFTDKFGEKIGNEQWVDVVDSSDEDESDDGGDTQLHGQAPRVCPGKLAFPFGGSWGSDGLSHPPRLETVSSDETFFACQERVDSKDLHEGPSKLHDKEHLHVDENNKDLEAVDDEEPDENIDGFAPFFGAMDENCCDFGLAKSHITVLHDKFEKVHEKGHDGLHEEDSAALRWADVDDSNAASGDVVDPDPDSFGRGLHDAVDDDGLGDSNPQALHEKIDKYTYLHEFCSSTTASILERIAMATCTWQMGAPVKVWQQHNIEAVLIAPWRRRKSERDSIFDMAANDSSDEKPSQPITPPGRFDFTTRIGFGIHDLLADDDHVSGALHDGDILQESNLHGETNEILLDDSHGMHVHDKPVQDELDVDMHDTDKQGYIFMMAHATNQNSHGQLFECVSMDFIRTLVHGALQHAHLVADRIAANCVLQDLVHKSWNNKEIWKDRTFAQQKMCVDKSKKIGQLLTRNGILQKDNSEIREKLTHLEEQIENLKTINSKFVKELSTARALIKPQLQLEDKDRGPAEKIDCEENDRLAGFLQAASVQKKMKLYCFRVQRDDHPQALLGKEDGAISADIDGVASALHEDLHGEARIREEIRQILRESIPDESVVQQAEARFWQMGTSITDYTTKALVLAAQSSSVAAESDDLATSSFGNESNES